MTPPRPEPRTAEQELMEKLASIEHDRWSKWHRYAKAHWEPDRIQRWDELALRLYEELAEEVKEKDREEVRKYWPLIQQAIDEARAEGKRDAIIEFCEGDRSPLAEYEAKAYEKGRAEGKYDYVSIDEAETKYKEAYAQGFSDCRERAAKIIETHDPWFSGKIRALKPSEK